MKRKVIFSIVAVALFGVAIAFSLKQEHEKESELLVKNIEALAEGDDDGDEDELYSCSNNCYIVEGCVCTLRSMCHLL